MGKHQVAGLQAFDCLQSDFAMLADGTWIPDDHSISASEEMLAIAKQSHADLLQALEAIMADYDAWQKGDIENPMAIVNEEKAIAAIKQAKGE